ncbi:MAG: carbamoyl-phosphate synthase large subunit [Oscillospiraceae bacterium]|nr:carbamoyl-phosphate synthase large subunit [Oscillospiraceae bacterium]
MPRDNSIQKVLVIGSGPIVIGQAAEFDYAGAQACRILQQEGIQTVLVNSNPATIMTDKKLADAIYLEPLTRETLRRIIEKERPDGLLAGLGGQTGLTLAMQLSRNGTLEKYGVRLLGSNLESIERAEDRERFRQTLEEMGQPVIPSATAVTVEEALRIAEEIGYPVIVRPAYTLGGTGGGIAENAEELTTIAGTGLDLSPISQVLVEKCIAGWKEIEFETMRDAAGNVIAVCSMENVDPVGIHTGDSIVVAPALTLADREYQMLRSAALDIITALGIVGGCNCQFALNPDSFEYAVIEVNPRVSRSSALASKATGYPIAKISTKLALGYTLDEIPNDITGKTCACFEPALDYVVVKFPKWPFDKFPHASRRLGTQMKATGEVMAIAPSFEMALMKAVRGAEISMETLNDQSSKFKVQSADLQKQDDRRIFTVFAALKQGLPAEEIHDITKIDLFFLNKLRAMAEFENEIAGCTLTAEQYGQAKRWGYPDHGLTGDLGCRLPEKEEEREAGAFLYKMVDTCAAEFEAQTPYFYSTVSCSRPIEAFCRCAEGEAIPRTELGAPRFFEAEKVILPSFCEARSFQRSGKPVIMVLGSGPIRIGQGIEFDYSSVHCVWTLREMGYDVVIVNNNPETVSTDYDTADRLYFEPLCPEDVWNIIQVEKPIGVVVAFGGQTAIKLTKFLSEKGIPILGTSADGIDTAEDRARFDALLERFGISRPRGRGVSSLEDALQAAEELGYPVLLRPSYVIGGQGMCISRDAATTERYMRDILSGGIENPVLVDKYMPGIELEVDVISDGEDVLIPGIMEHIERAGVHSGDSIAVYPPYNLNDKFLHRICEVSEKLALALGTKGLVNIQYLIHEDELYVIEVNPRASRTVPYISKVTNISMVDIAARIMLGEKLRDLGCGTGLRHTPPYYAVKVPVFSFEKLSDANSILGPEMKSTGEVLGLGRSLAEAMFKGLTAAGFRIPAAGSGVLLSVETADYPDILTLARRFRDLGMKLYATEGTAAAIREAGLPVEDFDPAELLTPGSGEEDGQNRVSLIVYTGAVKDGTMGDYIALHRRAMQLGIPCLTSTDTANALADSIAGRYRESNTELVDLNRMRRWRQTIPFTKMQDCGNDYIFIENFDSEISCPESLCVSLCRQHVGIGADGIVLMEPSAVADVRMRSFNRDGSEGRMAGNNLRCVAKYLYDKGYVRTETISVETAGGIRRLKLFCRDGRVSSVTVNMGKAEFEAKKVPVLTEKESLIDSPVRIGGKEWKVSCLSVGNPHCVTFVPNPDILDLETLGPQFEHDAMFPERVNTEFVRVVSRTALRMRVWERGSGETLACGTGACAAAAAAVENGLCDADSDIRVTLPGGDLMVRLSGGEVFLTGGAETVFTGSFEY